MAQPFRPQAVYHYNFVGFRRRTCYAAGAMNLRPLVFLFFALPITPCHAIDKISGATVTKGLWRTEYYNYAEDETPRGSRMRQRLQSSYGFSDRFDLAIAAATDDRAGISEEFTGPSIRPRFQLTRQGDWWLESAIQTRYTAAGNGGPDNLTSKINLQRKQGDWTVLANLVAGREIGANRRQSLTTSASARVFYDYRREIMPGFEYYVATGPLNGVAINGRQPHEIGPVLLGHLALDDARGFEYVAGYYRGLTASAPEQSGKLELRYVQQF